MASPTVVGEVDQHDNSTQLPPLVLSTFVKSFEFLSTKDDIQVQLRALLDHDVPPQFPPSIPEAVRTFFSSVASPTEILSSKLVSRVEGTDVIKGGYNFVHILNLDIGQSHPLFPFVLRFPIDPDFISRSQTRTAVGCMLYCQRHTELNIPTPVVYAYNCTYGSEFIAMEYLDGDTLSHVWLDIPEEDRQNVINQIVEIMRSMRTKANFRVIGGISPDGSACPLVDGMDGGVGMGLVESFGLYDTGPYESVREYVQAVFDRQFHYLDQILHKSTLLAHEAKFKEEMMSCLRVSTPEEIFERVKSKRDGFRAHPYDCEHPFVLRHGDLHGRNVIVSHSSPRCILGIIDWDFGGSHVLPFADDYFE
ncbi:kinase-like domain-containing protein [Boletus reticuloceps]|uniref:Kinase-like domain-containing protein n=1 Tax=Boletus reticuloceps TaxID=495285 RepID=A0A8I2YL51_9AGAM|nr:kinase-like domain-containing protein [Boletus reticuloceps]